MLPEVNRAVAPLRSALEADDWKALGVALHKISTESKKCTAISSETIRVTTDILIEECAFGTAFERAFVVRRALHGVNVAKWLHSALMNVNPASPLARRLVTLVECLATTEAGRTLLGRNKVVDAILSVWKRSRSSSGLGISNSNLPAALCALCSGHIDNIARVMRIGGVSLILKTIEAECGKLSSSEESADRKLLNNTLLLLGLVCICIPDKPTKISGANRKLIPLIAKIIRCVCDKEKLNAWKSVLAHAMNIIANIAECWRKEGMGFEIRHADALLGDILNSWKKAPRNRQVVNAAAWAITGLIRAKKVNVNVNSDINDDVNNECNDSPSDNVREELMEILEKSSRSISSVRALHRVLPAKEDSLSVSEEEEKASKKRPREVLHEEVPVPAKRPRLETPRRIPSIPALVNDKNDDDFSSPTRLDAFDFDDTPAVPSSPTTSDSSSCVSSPMISDASSCVSSPAISDSSSCASSSLSEDEEEDVPVAETRTTRRGREGKVPGKLAGYVA